MCGIFSACSHEDPTLFGKESDGFYFGYDSKEDLSSTINFADSILTEAKVGYVPIRVKLLGHMSDQATPIKLKAEPVDGYKEAKVTLPDVEVKAGEYETVANVAVECPEQEDTTYAVRISFEQADKSMKDFDSFIIYTKESYEKPSNWNDGYYGPWTADKFKFICKTLGKTGFCGDDSYTQTNRYNPTLIYAVRQLHKANPDEPVAYDIPFLDGTLFYDSYSQPDYWGDLQDKYFGHYDGYGFGTLASSLGVTTQNEEQVFGSTDEAVLKESNKGAVRLMLENYNNKFAQGYSYWGLNSAFSVPMIDGSRFLDQQPDKAIGGEILWHLLGAEIQEDASDSESREGKRLQAVPVVPGQVAVGRRDNGERAHVGYGRQHRLDVLRRGGDLPILPDVQAGGAKPVPRQRG